MPYLTKAGMPHRESSEEEKQSVGRGKVWLNLLVIEPYNNNPQVVHFKSNKVFAFSAKEVY